MKSFIETDLNPKILDACNNAIETLFISPHHVMISFSIDPLNSSIVKISDNISHG